MKLSACALRGCEAVRQSGVEVRCGMDGNSAVSVAKGNFGFKDAQREHGSVLARGEKAALIWMAQRAPAWVSSDGLTLLGFVALFFAGLSYWYSRWNSVGLLLVIFCLAVNWLGDSLDGTLARVRNRQRPRYGFYVDHVVDAFGALFLFGGLALSGYMSTLMALLLLIVYLMLCIESYLATYTLGVFHLSFAGFGPTELRILLAIGNIALLYKPMVHVWGGVYRLFDVGAAVAITGMGMALVASSVKNARRLYMQEKLP
jgi:archaetidylinositol phosphate synthase